MAVAAVLIASAVDRPSAPEPAPVGDAAPAPPSSAPTTAAPTSEQPSPPSGPPPSGPPRPALDGDVDGDGRRDAITVSASGTLRVRYADGTTDTVRFDASGASPTAGVQVLGAVDADGDGRAEVFVRAGSGASTDFAAVFRHVAGRLRLVTLDGGQALLGYGGSVGHLHSWVCRQPSAPIQTWDGTSTDGASYPGTLRSYHFAGSTLVLVSSRPLTVSTDRHHPQIDCASISL
ncbi:MAG TPA: VCBS repeat-containing protein [Mycobacteriales bacterium]